MPGDPIDLTFDPSELSLEPIAGQSGDRPGLISWGASWLNINKDHPVDVGTGELAYFVERCLRNEPFCVTHRDGLAAMQVAMTATRSARASSAAVPICYGETM